MKMMILAHKRQRSISICTLAIIQLLLVALLSMPIDRLSTAAYDTGSTTSLTSIGNSGYNLQLQLTDNKPELMYVLDSNMNRAGSQILLIDPQSGNTLRSFKANMAPDIALSEDGSRLYIASRLQGTSNGVLEVVNTTTGKLITSVDNPDHWISTLHVYSTHMALSYDGKLLYVFKHRQEDDAYYIATFDTVNNRFLPGKAMIHGCVTGRITPSLDNSLHITVTCSGTRDIRRLDLNENGNLAGAVERSELGKAIPPEHKPSRKLDTGYPAVTVPLGNDTKAAIIAGRSPGTGGSA